MSDIVILYNKSNPFGIQRDVQGIMESISGKKVKCADPLEPPMPCAVAVHLEIPVYMWMPWAAVNIFVVNPEWFEVAWVPYMNRFKYVIYKDSLSAEEAIAAGYVTKEQVKVIPWGASEPAELETKQGNVNTGFVWFLGGSRNKRAYVPKLLNLWRETYPPLRIYSAEPLDISGTSNVRFEAIDLDVKERSALAKFFRGHVACSEAEGFSYAAAEAEWYGAFTILNKLNCYVCDYKDKEGAYIFDGTQEDLDRAIQLFEKADLNMIAGNRKIEADSRYKKFQAALSTLLTDSLKLQVPPQLPPVIRREDCPPISIVTLMYNRRKFFELACHNILSTDYPLEKIEWLIVEDSDDPVEDASDLITKAANSSNSVKIVYIPLKKRTSVGAKRNIGVERATNDIILMMDDDDHYPTTSFRRRVAWLQHPWKPKAVAATTIACYDLVKGISAVNVPPLQIPLAQRISEATLTFYKSWWLEKQFPISVQVGEGEEFLSGRENDLLEIPPQQIVVAFSHGKNASSRRIPSGDDIKPGCFWGFPKEFLIFIHKLAGINVVEDGIN